MLRKTGDHFSSSRSRGGQVHADGRPLVQRPEPRNKLSHDERAAVPNLCNSAEFASLPPSRIVPELADPRLADPGLADSRLADPGLADPGLADPGLADPRLADPRLADQSHYLASEASFYRILRAQGQQHHRDRAKSPVRCQAADPLQGQRALRGLGLGVRRDPA